MYLGLGVAPFMSERLLRFLFAANLGSLVLCALGVVGVEFVLSIIFGSIHAWLSLPAPAPQLAAAIDPNPEPLLDPRTEAEAEAKAEAETEAEDQDAA